MSDTNIFQVKCCTHKDKTHPPHHIMRSQLQLKVRYIPGDILKQGYNCDTDYILTAMDFIRITK